MKNKYRICQEILEKIIRSNTKVKDMGLKRWLRTPAAQKVLFNNNIEMYNTFTYCYFKR